MEQAGDKDWPALPKPGKAVQGTTQATLDIDSKEAMDKFMAAATRVSGHPKTTTIAPETKKAEAPTPPAPDTTKSKPGTKLAPKTKLVSVKQPPTQQSTVSKSSNNVSDRHQGNSSASAKAPRAPWAKNMDDFNRQNHHLSPLARAPWADNPAILNGENNQQLKKQKKPPLWKTFVPATSTERKISAESSPMPPTDDPVAVATNATNPEEMVFSQHLYTIRKPRKDHPEDGSSDRNLSNASSIKSSGDMPRKTDLSRTGARSDIRSSIAPMHHLTDYGDRWVKVNWNAGPRDCIDDDTIFAKPSFITPFVLHWMKDAVDNIRVNLDVPNHWNSDIETETGRFLMPITMPETIVDPTPINQDQGWNFRRQNMTSDIMLKKHMADMARRAKDRQNKVRGAHNDWRAHIRVAPKPAGNVGGQTGQFSFKLHQPIPGRDPSSGPPSAMGSTAEDGTSATSPVVDGRGKYALGMRSNLAPSVPCYLRPAVETDMDAVAKIYNWEVTEGMQALDSTPVTVGGFKNILSTTKKLGMPFIVAVRGSARDIKAVQGNLEFSPYMQRSPYHADPEDIRQNGAILGFAYLSVWQPGLNGDGNGSSRASARINLFVDPKYRKKKIGFSLLDKLLSTVSRCFTSQQAYDFVDPSNSLVYKHPLAHERQYFRLYLTYFVKHAHDLSGRDSEGEKEQKTYRDDLVWVKKLLEKRFGFVEKTCFEASHRSSNYVKDQPVYWLDSVVFEHTCHLDARFAKSY